MKVQIRSCKDSEDGQVLWCDRSEADYFGVYVGEPGDFEWAADFISYPDAVVWAGNVASNYGYELENLTKGTV